MAHNKNHKPHEKGHSQGGNNMPKEGSMNKEGSMGQNGQMGQKPGEAERAKHNKNPGAMGDTERTKHRKGGQGSMGETERMAHVHDKNCKC